MKFKCVIYMYMYIITCTVRTYVRTYVYSSTCTCTSSSLPSYTEAIHHKNSTSLSTVPIAATTAIITTKGRPQELYYAGKIKEHRNISGRRVIAKIAVSARIN